MIHTDASTIPPGTHVMVRFEDPQWGNVYQPGRTLEPTRQSGVLWLVELDQALHGRRAVNHLTDGAEIVTIISDEPKQAAAKTKWLDIPDQDGDVLTVYRSEMAQQQSGHKNTALVLQLPDSVSAVFFDQNQLRTLASALHDIISELDETSERSAFDESVAGDPPRSLPLAGGCCGGSCHI